MNLEELCKLLKVKREEKGLTIEQVVEKTKLYPSAIRDIEDGNISSINPTYLKGFLKIYAAFLGIAVENALDEISTSAKPRREKKEKKENKVLVDFKPIAIPPQIKRFVILGVAGLLVLWLLASVIRFIGSHIPRLVQKPAVKAVATESVSQSAPIPKPASRDVVVALTAKRACFVRVKVDGKTFFVGTISRGRVESWKASKELEFRISDGSAVYLEVNGKPLPPLTSMHKAIKSLKVTSSGISISK